MNAMTRIDLIRTALRTSFLIVSIVTLSNATADSHGPSATPLQVVEMRKEGFNEIGWATKAISDQLKRRSPDTQRIRVAATTIANRTPDIMHWFPAGSGRESGADTDALPAIWQARTDFDALAQKLILESQQLTRTLQSDDLNAVRAQFTSMREVCSSCHRRFLARK